MIVSSLSAYRPSKHLLKKKLRYTFDYALLFLNAYPTLYIQYLILLNLICIYVCTGLRYYTFVLYCLFALHTLFPIKDARLLKY